MRIRLTSILVALLVQQLYAADGVLEINQSCAAVGCFPGDDAGFPVQITAAGSYILTSKLEVGGSAFGINIGASNVSLDLNAFEVAGDDTGGFSGISLNSGVTSVTVRNGIVRDFGSAGVSGCTLNCAHLRFFDLQVLSNANEGISFSGIDDIVVLNSVASGNGAGGLFLNGDAVIVKDCIVENNGTGDGIRVSNEALLVDNVVRNNGGDGIQVAPRSSVIGNIVTLNGEHGINLGGEALVKNNVAHMNNQSVGPFFDIEACATCTMVDNETP